MPIILEGDWTFVTRNALDWRGPKESPGKKGQYARTSVHAGLICLNGPADGTDLDLQCALFERALDELDADPDLVNQLLEITIESKRWFQATAASGLT